MSFLIMLTMNVFSQKKDNLEGIEIGTKAPEIVLPTVDGDNFQLSQLKGKVVMISFWASWCSPCRKKAPELIEVYEKFKNEEFEGGEKGFEIVYVSLDRNTKAWKESIEKDNIGSFINVGSMKGWKTSAAKKYNIRSVPSTVLIDGEGNVIELNISPQQLKKKLNKMKKGGWLWF